MDRPTVSRMARAPTTSYSIFILSFLLPSDEGEKRHGDPAKKKRDEFSAMISFEKIAEVIFIQGFHSIYRWKRRQTNFNSNF